MLRFYFNKKKKKKKGEKMGLHLSLLTSAEPRRRDVSTGSDTTKEIACCLSRAGFREDTHLHIASLIKEQKEWGKKKKGKEKTYCFFQRGSFWRLLLCPLLSEPHPFIVILRAHTHSLALAQHFSIYKQISLSPFSLTLEP